MVKEYVQSDGEYGREAEIKTIEWLEGRGYRCIHHPEGQYAIDLKVKAPGRYGATYYIEVERARSWWSCGDYPNNRNDLIWIPIRTSKDEAIDRCAHEYFQWSAKMDSFMLINLCHAHLDGQIVKRTRPTGGGLELYYTLPIAYARQVRLNEGNNSQLSLMQIGA